MAAYAAVVSLRNTIWQLLSRTIRTYRDSCDREIMEYAYKEADSLQQVVQGVNNSSDSEMVDAFHGEISDAVFELEDAIDSLLADQLLSQNEERLGGRPFSLDLREVKEYVDSFTKKVKKIKDEYIVDLNQLLEKIDLGASSIADFGGKMPKMVGLSDQLSNIKDWLMDSNSKEREFVSIVGMTGTGKTTLAYEVFEDPSILHHFQRRAWVPIGPKYDFYELVHCIFAQLNPEKYKKRLVEGNKISPHILIGSSSEIEHMLFDSFSESRYLIVLDDVWDTNFFLRLFWRCRSNLEGSRILVTTRIVEVARIIGSYQRVQEMRLMNEEESWDLVREKVFGEEVCHPDLERVGKRIAENCEGYPLKIIKTAQLLSKSQRTPECWSKVGAEIRNSVSMDMSKVSSTIYFDGKKPVTVGLSDELRKIKDMLLNDYFSLHGGVSVVGMAGIGKTTLAKEVFEDPTIIIFFDCRVWITIGPKYQLKEILQAIAVQLNMGVDFDIDMFGWHLNKRLKDRRYLIVLDDIWDTHIFTYLKSCCPFPDKGNGSRFLVTTPLRDALFDFDFRVHEMQLLTKEESWCLLRQKVFGEESCPFELEKPGKKIAEKCEGLPLAIVTVANLLSKESKTLDYWNEIAEAEENSVFNNAYDEMSSKLIRNYNYLPRHLKPCFLYLGVFSKKYVIPHSKLIGLWNAEGFIEQITEEDFAEKCLQELVARSVVMVCQQSSRQTTKTCKLHSVFWHLCNSVARKNKFFHVLSRYADSEGVKSARRISVRNSVLFRIKNIYDSMAAISTPRSVLYTGPHYQYSIQICSAWRLLSVLDAHSIRFYQFPIEVLILVQMRYFAITYNGKLPPSISKLQNLEYLIVHRYLSITSFEDPSYLPVEIWEMKKLKHLQVTGSDLPEPCGAQLPNLLTLLDVSARSCTTRVLESLPKLKKLGVRIELAPNADVVPSCCFDISYLIHLESLKCVIINPELNIKVVVPPITLPRYLRKLNLSGFGYPGKDISIITSLQSLEVLKLRSYAVCGPTNWEAFEGKLDRVEHLLLEDIDVEHLDGISSRFPYLERLIIRHCYGLKEIPSEIERLHSLKLIELVDCSPAVVDSAENIRKQNKNLEVRIHSSWK